MIPKKINIRQKSQDEVKILTHCFDHDARKPLERERKKTFWGVLKNLTTWLLILVFIGPLCTCCTGVFFEMDCWTAFAMPISHYITYDVVGSEISPFGRNDGRFARKKGVVSSVGGEAADARYPSLILKPESHSDRREESTFPVILTIWFFNGGLGMTVVCEDRGGRRKRRRSRRFLRPNPQ